MQCGLGGKPSQPTAPRFNSADNRGRIRRACIEALELRLLLSAAPSNPSLPANWSDTDIGSPSVAGSASASNGLWTVTGGGADIWNAADQFNFASESVQGDVTLVTHVGSLNAADLWAKAGVMIRNDSSPGSAFVDLFVTPGNGIGFQWRDAAGNPCGGGSTLGVAAPVWLKLVRSGTTFSGFYSDDGSTWEQVGSSETAAIGTAALAGLAVTAHNDGQSASATFTGPAIGAAPTIAVAASATPSPVTGNTTALSVLGADAGPAGDLTYTWATTGRAAAPVAFSDNGTNSASNTTATFTQPGTYNFEVTIANPAGLTVVSSVSVSVTMPDAAPVSPDGLSAVWNGGNINLSWRPVGGAQSYRLYRSATPGGEGAAPIASGLAGTSFLDTNVAAGQAWYYTVSAVSPANVEGPASTEAAAQAGVDVLSYHGGTPDSNGVNNQETLLTPGSVKESTFGENFATNISDVQDISGIPSSVLPASIDYASPSGQSYAEPLVKTGVTITTGSFAGTVHDVVFVATAAGSLFAIDANGGNVLWKDSFFYNPAGNPNPLNAAVPAGVTAVPGGYGTETNSQDSFPWLSIMSTPVIDAAGNSIYVIANTREVLNGDQAHPHYVFRLHRISLSDGRDTSAVIADTTINDADPSGPQFTYNSGPYVLGTGAGAVTVNGESRVYFNAAREMNRVALQVHDGQVYAAFASHGDNGPYHGWVLSFDATTLATTGAFCTTPNAIEGGAGIWSGGNTIVFDASGYFYVSTGNGTFDGNYTRDAQGNITYSGLDSNGFPVDGDYGDCFLELSTDPTTSQQNQGSNVNGWGIKVVDYFAPYNNHTLDGGDTDLGSGGLILLPASAGSAAHPELLVGAGKQGTIYVVDTSNMGKFAATDHVVQEVGNAVNGSLGTPAFFNGRLYYTSSYGGAAVSWRFADGTLDRSTVQSSALSFAFPGASPYISADGTQNGIAWMIDKGTGSLRAYDASDLSKLLWDSNQNPTRDALDGSIKFSVATPVNGRVYALSADRLVVYGPPTPPTSAPAAPSDLAATAGGASTINLSWTDNSDNEDGFSIERSNDGINFSVVGTAGVNQTIYQDTGLSPSATYTYRVRAYNSFQGFSGSAYTAPADATTSTVGSQQPVMLYHFDENGGVSVTDSAGSNDGLFAGQSSPTWVAPGRVGTSALAFSGDSQPYSSDGSAVQLANNLAPVLGGTSSIDVWVRTSQVGSDVHYAAPAITGVEEVQGDNDINWGYLDGSGRIGVFVGDSGGILSTNPVNDDRWHNVAITRDASTGVVRLYVDGVLNSTAVFEAGLKTTPFSIIGGLSVVQPDDVTPAGAVHFSGQLDELRVYNQVLDPSEVMALGSAPAGPTGLVVRPASGTELDLTWTDNTDAATEYVVQRSINGGPWATLPQLAADADSYNDTGLIPQTQYSYRVQAMASAGASDFSNTASATTPVPPSTPVSATTTLISTREIDLQWTDTDPAASGYRVLRRTLGGEFVALTNSLPGNATSYRDTGVTPGTEYDYHVQAYNIAGYSDFAGVSTATLTSAPTGLSVTDGNSQVTLNWTAPAFGGTAADLTYNVYRGAAQGAEGSVPVATGLRSSSFTDTSAGAQTAYYKVTATDPGGESAASNEASLLGVASAPVPAPPATPGGFTATGSQAGISLQWNVNAESDLAGYNLFRGASADGPFTQLNAGLLTATSFNDTTAAAGATSYYRVVAVNTAQLSSAPAGAQAFRPAAPVAQTIWSPLAAPAAALQNIYDPPIASSGGVELGMKFRSDVAGVVSGVQFWKGSLAAGTQTGELWTSTGQLLATATFSSETALGWQQVNFASAVPIAANTTYIVSYHTTSPYIAYGANTFATAGLDNGPLHALANGVDGSNSVYSYGAGAFPTTYNGQAPNYWVDVTFAASAQSPPPASPPPASPPPPVPPPPPPPPTDGTQGQTPVTLFSAAAAPAANLQNIYDPPIVSSGGVELGLKFRSDVAGTVTGVRFYKGSQNTGIHTGELWNGAGQLLATATFSNETSSGWQQVSFSSPVSISANTTYVISYHSASGYLSYTANAFSSGGIDNAPLHALASGVDGGNSVYSYGPSAYPSLFNGQSPNYWVDAVFSSASTAASPPAAPVPPAATSYSLFAPSAAPSQQNIYDPPIVSSGGVELGLKFRSDVAGTVTGVRFYKGSQNTGIHTGELWSSTGQLLATATFSNESASGWQQVNFSAPVSISPNTTYIVSYHETSGYLAYTPGSFASAGIDSGPLHALASGVDGGNSVYTYGAGAFPGTFNGQSANYWVDVVFSPTA